MGSYRVLETLSVYVVQYNHVFPLQANLLYSHIVDVKFMEENMNKLNWPTAFVIVAIIFAGAFVYSKPIEAALGRVMEL